MTTFFFFSFLIFKEGNLDSFFSALVDHSSHFARLDRRATFPSMCVSRKKKNGEENAPPPRGGIGPAFHSSAPSTRSPRAPVQRRRCRRRSRRSRDSLRPVADEAVGEAPGSRAQRERAERRCNGGENQEKIFRLSASRFARRFFFVSSVLPNLFPSSTPFFFFPSSCNSLPSHQAGSLTPLPPPSRLFPRSPSRSHGVKRAKPSLCCRFPHAADKAQGRNSIMFFSI